MTTFGTPELIIILVIIVLFFGLGKLSGVTRGLGRMFREFREQVKEAEPAPAEPTPLPDEPAEALEAPHEPEPAQDRVDETATPEPGLKGAVQDVLSLFQGRRWKTIAAQLETIRAEGEESREESRAERQLLLATIQELHEQVSQTAERLERVEETVTPEEVTRRRAALEKLKLIIVGVLSATAGSAYEPVVQGWQLPEKLALLKDRLEAALAEREPLAPKLELGRTSPIKPNVHPPEETEAPLGEGEPRTSQLESAPDPAPESQRSNRHRWQEPEMIIIPAGKFWLGTDRQALERAGVTWEDWMQNETPPHQVYLSAYAIGRYPVTNAQYQRFVRETGARPLDDWQDQRYPPGKKDHPVDGVFWSEAVAYCRWLSERTNKGYRLPTEAEWEKAARGTDGRLWPWGNRWHKRRANTRESGLETTTPVGQYSPAGDSPYGVADMAGNVYEWCATKYDRDGGYKPYPYDVREDEWAAEYLEESDLRILRGGGYWNDPAAARCGARDCVGDWFSHHRSFGFRLVRSP